MVRGEPIKVEGEINQMAMAPDGKAVAIGTEKGSFACIGVANGMVRGEALKLEGWISHMAMALDGDAVAVGTNVT